MSDAATPPDNPWPRRGYALVRLAFAALGAAAIATQLADSIRGGRSVVNFFSFFTIQSNLLAIVTLTCSGLIAWGSRQSDSLRRPPMLRLLTTFAMTTTGVVYALLLRGTEEDLQTSLSWVNEVLHVVVPLVVLVDWLALPPRPPLGLRRALLVLVFPIVWLAYTLVRGAATDWYPYPFLDVPAHGYLAVGATCVVLALAMAGLVGLLVLTGRRGGTNPAA